MNEPWPKREMLTEVGPMLVKPGVANRGTLRAGLADVPLIVYAGGGAGPVLYVQALQHGLELNGVDVMRRLVGSLNPDEVRGTLILAPMANTLAARAHMQSFPYPDRPLERGLNDMNRRWLTPIKNGPNHVDRVVAALAPIVAQADAVIDLHCHEYLYSPMALSDLSNSRCRELALSTGFDVLRHSPGVEGMFGRYCREFLGKPSVTIEMPPLRRVDSRFSTMGFRGVLNVLKRMGLLDGALALPDTAMIFGPDATRSQTIHAEVEGFMARHCHGGDRVDKGDLIADIWSPDTFEPVQSIRAPFDGVIVSIGRPPQVWGEPEHDFINVGERAVTVATPREQVTPVDELGLSNRQSVTAGG